MSDFLAEARVLIQPDTTSFRAQLAAQVEAAARGVVVPVQVAAAPVAQTGALTSALAAQAAATQATTAATAEAAAAQRLENQLVAQGAVIMGQDTAAVTANTASQVQNAAAAQAAGAAHARAGVAIRAHAASYSQLTRGAEATGLSLLGVRGATLAASSSFLAGAAAVTLLAKSVQSAASLEQNLNVFRITAGATADEMRRVSEEAQRLGADITLPAVSAVDAAEAMTQLAKAGLDTADALAATRGVLQLSAAAQISQAEATQLAASALNAFGLAGSEAIHVADLLANAANLAQGSISDVGLSLQQAAAVARQVGISLEDTVALLTLLAQNGIRGSDAGTSLRVAFTRLINPTEKAKEVLEDLNVTLRDAEGNIRADVFSRFAEAQRGLTRRQQDANAAIVFGTDALRAYAIVSREGLGALNDTRDALQRQGAAAELAAARAQGLAGEALALESNLQTLGITVGKVVSPAIESLASGLNLIVGGLNRAARAAEGFLSRADFDAANASLDELVGKIADLQDELGKAQGGANVAFRTELLKGQIEPVAAELEKVALQLGAIPTAVPKLVAAFTAASPQIKAAMQDGVITPLERAQLEADDLGRIFVAALPDRFFSGLGAGVRSALEDATALARTGVADLGSEIRSGIEDASRAAVVAARQLGSDVGNALREALEQARKEIAQAQGRTAGLQEQFNAILAGGASPQEQIANLRRQAEQQRQIIEAAGPGAAGDALKARREARAKLVQILNQIDAIEKGIVSDQQAAARDAETRSRDAQKARDRADQAFLDALRIREIPVEIQEIQAQASGSLRQQREAAVARKKLTLEQIRLINEHVKDRERARDLIAALRTKVVRIDAEIRQLSEEIARSQQEAAAEAADALTAGLQARLRLAELRGDKDAIAAALDAAITNAKGRVAKAKRLLEAAKRARKGVQDAKNALLEEQIALQDLINQRDELAQTTKDASGDAARFFFEQLQAQQGFASNLLGNLIPAGQTAGLVGVPSGQPVSPPGGVGGPTDIGAQVSAQTAAAEGRSRTSPTAGQASTTNEILRRILKELRDINRAADNPEAIYQAKMGVALMDGGGGNTEVM